MKLYLLRHGEAIDRDDPRYANDADRPLTAKGTQRTRALARALRQMDITFDAIFSSPLTRARETAEIIERGLSPHRRLALTEHLAPSGDLEKLVRRVGRVRAPSGSICLVGHEPDLSSLISLLCTGGPDLSLTLKKGGLCRLQIESLRAGRCASLEWLMAPLWIERNRANRP